MMMFGQRLLSLLIILTVFSGIVLSKHDVFEEAMHAVISEARESHKAYKSASKLETLFSKYNSRCTGGKLVPDYKGDYKAYLKDFRNGPCAPIMFVPGIAGSKLIAQIDCYTMKNEAPKVFKACGWETCKGDQFVPKSEYVAWIPPFLGVNSFLLSSKRHRTCF